MFIKKTEKYSTLKYGITTFYYVETEKPLKNQLIQY